ncbi:HtaA domain-containing protein [Streptomyces sp. NPDC003300]|uniref:HtaA domain-containing protein n=1 Tax=unclassified Streptomyces TaxID=2593676 RepID=UPI0033BF7897
MTARLSSRALALAIATATAGAATALLVPAFAAADSPSSPAVPLTGGTFDWGVKQSFRSYVTGPAGGTITTADGATANSNGTFHFTNGQGSYDTSTHGVTVGFDGSVEFASTLHGFDIKLADLKVVTVGTTGKITADVTAAGSTSNDVEFATLDLSNVRPGGGAGGAMTFNGIPATLTADGSSAFNGMYQPGTALDAADLSVTPGAAPTTTPTTNPPTTNPPTGEPTGEPTATPTTTAPGGPAAVVDGNLDWGVKQSFRSYVTGPIADGKVELTDGATGTASGYRFPKGAGTYDADTKTLNASFSGGVRFLGHLQQGTYALDLKFGNFAVATKGATGTLTADVSAKDMASGKVTDYKGIAVATLSGVAPTADGDVVTVSGASAVLTEDGAKAFSGFYKAGDALDPVTVAVSLDDSATLPTGSPSPSAGSSGGSSDGGTTGGSTSGGTTGGSGSTVGGTGNDFTTDGELASTGSGTPSAALLAAAGALVVTGAAATVTVARRRNTV